MMAFYVRTTEADAELKEERRFYNGYVQTDGSVADPSCRVDHQANSDLIWKL